LGNHVDWWITKNHAWQDHSFSSRSTVTEGFPGSRINLLAAPSRYDVSNGLMLRSSPVTVAGPLRLEPHSALPKQGQLYFHVYYFVNFLSRKMGTMLFNSDRVVQNMFLEIIDSVIP